MSDLWDTLGKTLDTARREAERLAQEAGRGMSDALGHVQELVGGAPPTDPLDVAALPEHQRVAYAGALYALAAADGGIDKDELQLLIDLIDLEGLSPGGRALILSYVVDPPTLNDTLAPFTAAPDELRYALLLHLVEIGWANDLLGPRQDALLVAAQQALGVGEEQYRAIWRFIRELRAVRLRGQNDGVAAQATRAAAAGLAAVGVPLAAVYVSGSVIGLSAAGITSGLAALGLGLGMVPGIGVAALLGTGAFLGVRALLNAAGQSEAGRLRGDLARRARAVLASIDEMVALLERRMQEVEQAGNSQLDGLRLAALHERRRALLQIAARRRALAETTA